MCYFLIVHCIDLKVLFYLWLSYKLISCLCNYKDIEAEFILLTDFLLLCPLHNASFIRDYGRYQIMLSGFDCINSLSL